MKTISLWNPWATILAYGIPPLQKCFETRSWPTKHRGAFAIHAAKHTSAETDRLCLMPGPIHDAMIQIIRQWGPDTIIATAGAIIAVGELVDCVRVPDLYPVQLADGRTVPPAEPELSFGDYTPGRYAWVTKNVRLLPRPIPWRGSQGFFDVPDEVVAGMGVGR